MVDSPSPARHRIENGVVYQDFFRHDLSASDNIGVAREHFGSRLGRWLGATLQPLPGLLKAMLTGSPRLTDGGLAVRCAGKHRVRIG